MNYSDLAPAVELLMRDTAEAIAHHANSDPMLPRIEPLQPTRPKRFRWLFSVAALISVLFACSGLYAMWQDSKGSNIKSVEQDSRSIQAPARVSELRSSASSSMQVQ